MPTIGCEDWYMTKVKCVVSKWCDFHFKMKCFVAKWYSFRFKINTPFKMFLFKMICVLFHNELSRFIHNVSFQNDVCFVS